MPDDMVATAPSIEPRASQSSPTKLPEVSFGKLLKTPRDFFGPGTGDGWTVLRTIADGQTSQVELSRRDRYTDRLIKLKINAEQYQAAKAWQNSQGGLTKHFWRPPVISFNDLESNRPFHPDLPLTADGFDAATNTYRVHSGSKTIWIEASTIRALRLGNQDEQKQALSTLRQTFDLSSDDARQAPGAKVMAAAAGLILGRKKTNASLPTTKLTGNETTTEKSPERSSDVSDNASGNRAKQEAAARIKHLDTGNAWQDDPNANTTDSSSQEEPESEAEHLRRLARHRRRTRLQANAAPVTDTSDPVITTEPQVTLVSPDQSSPEQALTSPTINNQPTAVSTVTPDSNVAVRISTTPIITSLAAAPIASTLTQSPTSPLQEKLARLQKDLAAAEYDLTSPVQLSPTAQEEIINLQAEIAAVKQDIDATSGTAAPVIARSAPRTSRYAEIKAKARAAHAAKAETTKIAPNQVAPSQPVVDDHNQTKSSAPALTTTSHGPSVTTSNQPPTKFARTPFSSRPLQINQAQDSTPARATDQLSPITITGRTPRSRHTQPVAVQVDITKPGLAAQITPSTVPSPPDQSINGLRNLLRAQSLSHQPNTAPSDKHGPTTDASPLIGPLLRALVMAGAAIFGTGTTASAAMSAEAALSSAVTSATGVMTGYDLANRLLQPFTTNLVGQTREQALATLQGQAFAPATRFRPRLSPKTQSVDEVSDTSIAPEDHTPVEADAQLNIATPATTVTTPLAKSRPLPTTLPSQTATDASSTPSRVNNQVTPLTTGIQPAQTLAATIAALPPGATVTPAVIEQAQQHLGREIDHSPELASQLAPESEPQDSHTISHKDRQTYNKTAPSPRGAVQPLRPLPQMGVGSGAIGVANTTPQSTPSSSDARMQALSSEGGTSGQSSPLDIAQTQSPFANNLTKADPDNIESSGEEAARMRQTGADMQARQVHMLGEDTAIPDQTATGSPTGSTDAPNTNTTTDSTASTTTETERARALGQQQAATQHARDIIQDRLQRAEASRQLEVAKSKAKAATIDNAPTKGPWSKMTVPTLIGELLAGCVDLYDFMTFLVEANVAVVNDKYIHVSVLPTLRPSAPGLSKSHADRVERWSHIAVYLANGLIFTLLGIATCAIILILYVVILTVTTVTPV